MRTRSLIAAVLGLTCGSGVGCQSKPQEAAPRRLQPADFVAPATEADTAAAPAQPEAPTFEAVPAVAAIEPPQREVWPRPRLQTALASASAPPQPDPAPGAAPDAATAPAPEAAAQADPTRLYSTQAMVGQVNGHPIYADRVLGPLATTLEALGRTATRNAFQREAKALIAQMLESIVTDALLLGEAERALSLQEQQGLRQAMTVRRAELLRQYGEGAVDLANARSIAKDGKSIDQRLEEFRQQMLVNKYLREKLLPNISVTRKDIERYYTLHLGEYQPAPSRTVHLIRTDDAQAADKIDAALAAGENFLTLAADKKLNPKGLSLPKATGQTIFGVEALNEPALKLDAGRHSPRIKLGDHFCWVFVEAIEAGRQRPLREVQLEIEAELRRQQYQYHAKAYRNKLFREGSYNSLEQMVDDLLEVALGRWAPLQ